MKKVWFNRMIWSYIPIFLSIGCFLFFIFFQILIEQNKKDAMKANQVFTEQVQYFIDGALQSIDHTFIMEMTNNEWIRAFFDSTQDKDVYLLYRVADRLKKVQQMNNLIDSVYLVRFEDGLVFNGNLLNQRERFPDNEFITEMKKENTPVPWSNLRSFHEFTQTPPYDVITLVRKSTDNTEKGMVVINVSTSALKRKIGEMYNDKFRFVGLYDRGGKSLFGTEDNKTDKKGVITASVVSAYTGWEIRSGLLDGSLIGKASILSSVWTLLGIIAFTLGIASIIYVTRRNYKPIDDLLIRVRSFSTLKTSTSAHFLDEFAFIGSTLDQMKEQSEKLRQQYDDDLRVRIKFFFHQQLNGFQSLSLSGWSETMEGFGMPKDFHRRRVCIAEIDQFKRFQISYERKDRDLIKFVISKALQEVMLSQQLEVWSDWTSEHQLSGIVICSGEDDERRFIQGCEQLQAWVCDNLNNTLTIGIGLAAEEPSQLSVSYREAKKALQYKAVTGFNSILSCEAFERRHGAKGEMLKYTPMLKRTIELFGIDASSWEASVKQLFTHMKQDQLPREYIDILLHDWLHHLDLELTHLTRTDTDPWKTEELPRLRECSEQLETLDEIEPACMEILSGVFERVKAVQEGNKTREVARQVKEYIETNYSNPDLSLEHLGQTFHMNPKYLSQLFKNECGYGFIDFLIDIRIRQAQTYLIETDWAVQDIAEQVGYVNPISFRRAFKKTVGLSPGDYRKCKGATAYS
ncbi:helix-turn-helix domain-containing protein [Paenibacillus filicis]|uniref:Helix-turn-helix domain-containing protein n=1 Tax=Paenibacillus gyeongsangnamensis TaxID=3388067 RepID=A0ABT4QBQ3_9BACL|nr:helix-turn-helix domain-containing protein [Paenibacillus filicis]MCZ8514243.1 helix-turn-helix domain-containing protein [Paenibacillus filicis]